MSELKWDQVGERFYETGVKKCALFVYDNETKSYGKGVAWSGITSISESPSGAESNPIYADDTKYLDLLSAEQLGLTIEAYQSPAEFDACDGTATLGKAGVVFGQQSRKAFAVAYITTEGNDTDGNDYGEKLHIVYGCKASPSERSYSTINDSPEAMTLSWTISTTPVEVTKIAGAKPTSRVIVDKVALGDTLYKKITDSIYGTSDTEPTMLLPDAIYDLVNASQVNG